MNGVLVINKEKGYTSRDVVNLVSKKLGTRKVGHTGTLDPLATGVLVLCVGKSLKLVELLMNHDKEYIATIKLGIETDTLDITGTITKKEEVPSLKEEQIKETLKKFIGKIEQEVPKYSAIKVHGKKLYEYARNGIEVKLPTREVQIYDIKLISNLKDNQFTIWCSVSKGTYIRSLIRDIGRDLGTVATMVDLKRTKLGKFTLEDATSLEDLELGKYQLLAPVKVLDFPKIIVDEQLEKKIRNGQVLEKFFQDDMAMILNKNEELIAIYHRKDEAHVKPYRMFL